MMRKIPVYGTQYEECRALRNRKMREGWRPVTKILFDDTFIGGRWVCIMQRPLERKEGEKKFNRFMAF